MSVHCTFCGVAWPEAGHKCDFESEPYLIVHSPQNWHTCPKARTAFYAGETVAEQILKDPTCMACGGELEVKRRGRDVKTG